jgi:hypothetical protein
VKSVIAQVVRLMERRLEELPVYCELEEKIACPSLRATS